MAKHSAAVVTARQASKQLQKARSRTQGTTPLTAQGQVSLGHGAYFKICKGLIPDSAVIFQKLQETVAWSHKEVMVMGRRVPQPRLVAYMADNDSLSYTYSHATLKPTDWTETALQIKSLVEQAAGCSFNSCLLNLYRTGADHISWHSDNEPLYGPSPTIGSASFGAARDFVIRRNVDRGDKHSIYFESGDVLVMSGSMQQHWMHCVPKRARINDARISLTFRSITQPQAH